MRLRISSRFVSPLAAALALAASAGAALIGVYRNAWSPTPSAPRSSSCPANAARAAAPITPCGSSSASDQGMRVPHPGDRPRPRDRRDRPPAQQHAEGGAAQGLPRASTCGPARRAPTTSSPSSRCSARRSCARSVADGQRRVPAHRQERRRDQGRSTKPNELRLRAFNVTSGPEKGSCRLLAFVGGQLVADVTDQAAGELQGRASGFSLGAIGNAKGVVGELRRRRRPRPEPVLRHRPMSPESTWPRGRIMRRRCDDDRASHVEAGPGSGLGGDWRVIVRNDNHNTFDHVAETLAGVLPGVTVDQRPRDRRADPQQRPGDRLVRPARARRALLGAARVGGPDDGAAGARVRSPRDCPSGRAPGSIAACLVVAGLVLIASPAPTPRPCRPASRTASCSRASARTDQLPLRSRRPRLRRREDREDPRLRQPRGRRTRPSSPTCAREVYDTGDRGILGLALDPKFDEGRPYVYVLYTYDHMLGEPAGAPPKWGEPDHTGDACPKPESADVDACPVSGRLVRLTAEGDHAAEEARLPKEHVLVKKTGASSSPRTRSATSSSAPTAPSTRAAATAPASTSPTTASSAGRKRTSAATRRQGSAGRGTADGEGGALRSLDLRTPATHSIPRPTRPTSTARSSGSTPTPARACPATRWPRQRRRRTSGGSSATASATRSASRSIPRGDELYVDNVGWNEYEEIDRFPTVPGQAYNSGWPCWEGPESAYVGVGLNLCDNLIAEEPGATSPPFFYYSHDRRVTPEDPCPTTRGSALTGIAFYEGERVPVRIPGRALLRRLGARLHLRDVPRRRRSTPIRTPPSRS